MRKEFKDFIIKNLVLPEEDSYILAESAKFNTYVETISEKADNLHLKIKQENVDSIHISHGKHVRKIILKQRLGLVDLVCDITSEDFYGKVSGLYISPWTGKDGVTGKFSYLVVRIGCSKAELIGKAISYCQSLGLKIKKILLDRGFYSGEVINEIKMSKVNYLIFAPKRALFKCMLEGADKSVIIEHEIRYNKGFTRNKAPTDIALIKDVLDYDWVFATDLSLKNIKKYVAIYRKRWNIETMFRVHDEARIKTKSKNPIIRLFYFIVGMLLVLIWNIYEKQKLTFKKFVIMLSESLDKKLIVSGNY